MTKLNEILDEELLEREIADGYVRVRYHPLYPELAILNYTEKTQFERHWNDVTRITRGLIVNTKTGDILARPFQKIHNFDEQEAPKIEWDQVLYHWGDKLDGSLGIVYQTPDGLLSVATRGSFESDQAKFATAWLRYEQPEFHEEALLLIDNGYTPLFEIIYPENRIVLDYGDFAGMMPLGMMHIETGMYIPHPTTIHSARTFGETMIDLSRPNAEGWVVWVTPFKGVKIKQADYIELHRVVTGLNQKSVWRALKDGYPSYIKLLESLPDELTEWAKGVGNELMDRHAVEVRRLDQAYVELVEQLSNEDNEGTVDRKTFAIAATKNLDRAYLFLMFDGKDITQKVWDKLEPQGGDR